MRVDSYTWRARIAPGVLIAAPPLALLAGGAFSPSAFGRVSATVTTVALIVLSQLTRDAGRRLQPRLWRDWGGAPTVQKLRHRDAERPARVVRLHQLVEQATGERLPTATEEAADPDAADARYDDAVAVLRELTRKRENFPLVFEENVNYGFRRNTLGVKPSAIAIAALVLVIACIALLTDNGSTLSRVKAWGPGIGTSLVALVFWLTIVTPDWVRLPADTYAERLFEAVQRLSLPAADRHA
jgi:hypothetical protein